MDWLVELLSKVKAHIEAYLHYECRWFLIKLGLEASIGNGDDSPSATASPPVRGRGLKLSDYE